MSVGFIMLAHQNLDRAAQVSGYWAQNDLPVVLHIDAKAEQREFDDLKASLAKFSNVRYAPRRNCGWGEFSIVAATLDAARLMLDEFPEVNHVFLASGSCLPLRPAAELRDYLAERPETDFIESVTTEEVTWTVGGLDLERFTLHFPFSWKRHRRLFDRFVNLQRRVGYSRHIPEGVEPHLGSQWWCLTRKTLAAILDDPQRQEYDRYFSRVWIPDESYFQSLVRKHSTNIESRSLTFSRFDNQGKPHVFYDDHLQLLQKSDCFVARKIWPHANLLYRRFLGNEMKALARIEPNPRKLDKVFVQANLRRTRGRAGRRMQSRFPMHDLWAIQKTCAPYSVFEGFTDLFSNFQTWLEKRTGARVHGHLFGKRGAEFVDGAEVYAGCLSSSAKLRDYNPRAFLENLLWNTQGEYQCFQFGPADRQAIGNFLASDQNARIHVITGAWAVPLFHSNMEFGRIRRVAARYQAIEAAHVEKLRSPHTRAQVKLWTLAEFVENPMPVLQTVLNGIDPGASRKLTEVPRLVDLQGFGRFVQKLKNEGMNPHSVGDFPLDDIPGAKTPRIKPYAIS